MISILPPARGKPSGPRSTTFGASAKRVANHGLTVWRSEDATSAGGPDKKTPFWLGASGGGVGNVVFSARGAQQKQSRSAPEPRRQDGRCRHRLPGRGRAGHAGR